MIVRAIYLRNFLRFVELSLSQIPADGVIGIVGENESGKSTILEGICFSLYGRTVKVTENEVVRLIHWRSSELETRLDFLVGTDCYRVVRHYDRHGGRRALLYSLNNESEVLVCEGLDEVDAKIESLVRISFPVFCNSFYLGQKELSHLFENRASSIEVMEEMTGLARLKKAHAATAEKIPQLQDRITDLHSQIAVARVQAQHQEELLSEKATIQSDRQRQEERLKSISEKERQEATNLKLVESLKGSVLRLSQTYRKMIHEFFGVEILRRLGNASGVFLWLLDAAQSRVKALKAEADELSRAIEIQEQSLSSSSGLQERLKSVALLVEERVLQIQRNLRSHFGSQNMRSYLLPDTLKDKQILLQSHAELLGEQAQKEARAYNFSLILLLVYGIGLLALFLEYGTTGVVSLAPSHKFGLGLFLGCGGLLLVCLLVYKNVSLKESKDALSRLELNRLNVEKELQAELEEMSVLQSFSPEQIYKLEDLTQFRAQVSYEKLRSVIGDLIRDQESHPESFKIAARELKQEKEAIAQKEAQLRNLHLEIQSMESLLLEYQSLRAEVESWSFIKKHVAESSLVGATQVLQAARDIFRLRELLRGDFSHRTESLSILSKQYNDELDAVVRTFKEHSELLPSIWDEKRLRFNESPERYCDLDLMGLIAKQREMQALEDHFVNLLHSWMDKVHKVQESYLREEMGKQSSEQRLKFMDEALEKMRKVEKRRAESLQKLSLLENELEVAHMALEENGVLLKLLQGTIDSLRARLSPNLSRFIGSILPRITNGRYDRVKVSLDLEITVFSPEKEGFVDFMALSGGTADQLLICLRLAFAASLLQTRFDSETRQFLFLDEPLAAFDAKRASQFLDLIREFHSGFKQTFLVTHNQQLLSQFKTIIRTGGDKAVIEVNS